MTTSGKCRQGRAGPWCGGLLLAVLASPVMADWFDLQPAYDFENEFATIRLEAVNALSDKWSYYGFLDFNGTMDEPLELEGWFTEHTVRYSPADPGTGWADFAAAAEVDAGSGLTDVYRFGITWGKSLWQGNWTGLKGFVVATADSNAMASLFVSQDFTGRFSMYLVFDYGWGTWVFGEEQTYLEIEAKYRVAERLYLFAQGREFRGVTDWDIDLDLVMGLKYRF